MLNVVRSGTAVVAGVASGILAQQDALKVSVPTGGTCASPGAICISPSSIAEGVAFVIGAGLQFLSPNTMPNLSDGLVDGGAALLARRGAAHLAQMVQTGTTYPGPGGLAAGQYTGNRLNGAMAGAYYGNGMHSPTAGLAARGQSASAPGLPHVRLS